MRPILTVLFSSILLAACGGGSDDGPAAPGNPGSPGGTGQGADAPAAVIAESNYVSVAQKTLAANGFLVDSSAILPVGAEVVAQPELVQFAQAQIHKVPGWFARSPVTVAGATESITERCSQGGFMTVSATDANNNGIADAGDSLSISADRCRDGGVEINGSLFFVFTRVSGNLESYPYSIAATITYRNLTLATAQESLTGNGSIAIDARVDSPSQSNVRLDVDSFTVSYSYAGKTDTQGLYRYTVALAQTRSTNTSSVNGIFVSSALDSRSVRIATTSPFVTQAANRYPSSGSATIHGAAGASVRVTAVDASAVRLELDANGDGQYEISEVRRWNELH
ncbi:hypothetical protein [Comamonas sp. NLF-1-9]|uniref:hypothetical protein n=1 Tax=Comamonas sp. NLF-1-9 TaxID=2853163 RepID=UPI001C44DD81|nr:hypothetical protein [Comamonas sp. NLF-1-9]QXL84482.1 hypothetical protein KUD94_00315 [Comamonas sp. NLF-1-9]